MSARMLWHYTCDHGRDGIGDFGVLRSTVDLSTKAAAVAKRDPRLRELLSWVWLTDLDTPMRDALGLTSYLSECDRTAHRYQVLDGRAGIVRWTEARRYFAGELRDELEGAPGAMPRHWFVAPSGVVRVVYLPLVRASAFGATP